jgi:glycosyltransferase involved in cell wall biosynthesis
MVQKTINIGFVLRDPNWHGGINYLRSLTSALNLVKSKNINQILFVPSQSNMGNLRNFEIKIIKSKLFNDSLINKIILKLTDFIFKKNIILELYFKYHRINILSHTNYTKLLDIKLIGWIGDFQYLHLKNFFGKISIKRNIALHTDLAKFADQVIVSCNYSLVDFNNYHYVYKNKVNVLKFVPTVIKPSNLLSLKELKKRFHINEDFYFIPNQFWKHKNHLCLLKAIKYLNSNHIYPNFVFTGKMDDHRNNEYVQKIKKKIDNLSSKKVQYLGEISYLEVCSLMFRCKAVINPSFFEGWSTSVEEAKIYNKICILSKIPTHIEQKPNRSIYFNPSNPIELAKAILKTEKMNIRLIKFNNKNYITKRKKFGFEYLNIIKKII